MSTKIQVRPTKLEQENDHQQDMGKFYTILLRSTKRTEKNRRTHCGRRPQPNRIGHHGRRSYLPSNENKTIIQG
eukprot:1645461-Ditylum_brightwellii.AAC.1